MQWRDDLKSLQSGDHAKGVPWDFLLAQAERWKDEHPNEPIRILVKGKKKGEIKAGMVVEPEYYELYIEGWDSEKEDYRCMEDFPIIKWP